MGVRHLESYICNDVENGFFPVNIKDEVENWKRNNPKTNKQPIIVFDVLGMTSFASTLFPDLGVTLCGGRHQFLVEKCTRFFNRLIDLGVKLVFFTDGPVHADRYPTWYERQNKRYINMLDILNDVYSNLNTQEIVTNYINNIPDSVNIPPLKVACKNYGEFHKSFNIECDLDIAKFATRNKALAVIADDTDFLMFEGDWKYWSSKNLNYNSLTTMEYNKIALLKNLGLSIRQMPLFATVGGNDIVRYDSVRRFHHACRQRYPYMHKFLAFARYVKFLRNYPANMNDHIIQQISYDLFENADQEQTDLIVQSLEFYNIRRRPAEPLQDELLSRTFNELHAFIYEVLTGISTSYTIVFFDFRKTDFTNYYDLIERLILRSMGVLLKHKNDPNLKRKILTKKSQDESYREFEVTPEYPEMEVPSLMKLFFDQNDESITPIRYELLAWILSDRIQAKTLQEIPSIYLSDILTLIYLLENAQITLIEVDSVLRTIHDVQNKLVPVDISSPLVIDERAMRFAFLYIKIFSSIKDCLSVVGINKMETKFDALYYHTIYKEYKVIPDGERENLMENLNDLRSYCLAAL